MRYKFYSLLFIFATVFTSIFAQNGNTNARFAATMLQTSSNSVMVIFRPDITFSGQFSNLQFTFQIPSSATPQPTFSIKSNPLSAYVPTASYTLVTTLEPSFVTYSFNVNISGASIFNFVGGTEYNALEVSIDGNLSAFTDLRLAHLANGGSTTQEAFYVEINGNDNTEYSYMFYGSGAINGGSESAYSYLPLTSILLPVKFIAFNALKHNADAVLKWTVTNETEAVNNYEIERSLDAITFIKIATISKNTNSINSPTYTLIDKNIASLKPFGIIYYRIKQIDLENNVTLSEVKKVHISDRKLMLSVYPNPVKENATIEIIASADMEIKLTLMSSNGSTMLANTLQVFKGLNTKKIMMRNYPSGNYILKVMMGSYVQVTKIIKE
ncbi:MAG: T9SS type A sorting domain-containing protein [Deinococcales bacterium]|nr:T9SS type A sorting domain-containing protein [Chitinophagaceae bacterium]